MKEKNSIWDYLLKGTGRSIKDFVKTEEQLISHFKETMKGKKIEKVEKHKNGSVIIYFEDGGWLGINDKIWDKIKDGIECKNQ